MMEKSLSDMTLEELWQLFPIQLKEHDLRWESWYEAECAELKRQLPENVQVHHIGSTAIGSIWAKPIIDILVETNPERFPVIEPTLIACGYTCMNAEPQRRDYCKGYTPHGFAEEVFHLHLRGWGDHDELFFRDYLIEHPDIAKQYESLKLSLWKKYEHDRDGYTDAKGAFIAKWTQEAKLTYKTRYL